MPAFLYSMCCVGDVAGVAATLQLLLCAFLAVVFGGYVVKYVLVAHAEGGPPSLWRLLLSPSFVEMNGRHVLYGVMLMSCLSILLLGIWIVAVAVQNRRRASCRPDVESGEVNHERIRQCAAEAADRSDSLVERIVGGLCVSAALIFLHQFFFSDRKSYELGWLDLVLLLAGITVGVLIFGRRR